MYVTTDLDCLALVVVEGGREQSPPRIWTMSATATTQGSYDRAFSQGSSCVYYVTEGAARSVLTLLIWNQRSTPPPDECCFSDKHNVRREHAGLHALSGHVLNGSTCCAFQCSSMRSLRFSPSAMRLIHNRWPCCTTAQFSLEISQVASASCLTLSRTFISAMPSRF